MAPDILARLFEPFTQADRSLDRSRGGLGLGLALVKGLVGLHGGSVQASSPGVGKGSEFLIRLPTSAAPSPGAPPACPGGGGGGRRGVFMGDNGAAAGALRLLVGRAGPRAVVAPAGGGGLAAARESRPDVVLCDIGLPGGMDGYTVARVLRAD